MLELTQEERIGCPPPMTKIHIIHDLNMQGVTKEQIKYEVLNIARSRQKPIRKYKIKRYLAHHLQEAVKRYGHQAFLNRVRERDIIVLNVLTKDCRDMRNAKKKTTREVSNLQRELVRAFTLRTKKGIILASPPCKSVAMESYNGVSRQTANEFGFVYAETIVAKRHLATDELHIRDKYRFLLAQSLAASLMGENPYVIYRKEIEQRMQRPLSPPAPLTPAFPFGDSTNNASQTQHPPPGFSTSFQPTMGYEPPRENRHWQLRDHATSRSATTCPQRQNEDDDGASRNRDPGLPGSQQLSYPSHDVQHHRAQLHDYQSDKMAPQYHLLNAMPFVPPAQVNLRQQYPLPIESDFQIPFLPFPSCHPHHSTPTPTSPVTGMSNCPVTQPTCLIYYYIHQLNREWQPMAYQVPDPTTYASNPAPPLHCYNI